MTTTTTRRKCGTCSVCCYVAPVESLGKPARTRCKWDVGGMHPCVCYRDRPRECRVYQCSWLEGKLSTELRPDRCGVLFETFTSKAFEPPLTILMGCVVDEQVMDENLDLIEACQREHQVIIIASETRYHEFGGRAERACWKIVQRAAANEGACHIVRPDGVQTVTPRRIEL